MSIEGPEPGEPLASYVSDPTSLPDGAVFTVDLQGAPRRQVDAVVGAVVAALEQEGVEGRLSAPLPPPDGPEGPAVSVVAVAAPSKDGGVRRLAAALDLAVEWLHEGSSATRHHAATGGVGLLLTPGPAEALFRQWLDASRGAELQVDQDADQLGVAAHLDGAPRELPSVRLWWAGASVVEDLDGAVEQLLLVARRLAQHVPWVFASVSRGDLRPTLPWQRDPEPAAAAAVLPGQVLDAHHWQVLPPEAFARLPAAVLDGSTSSTSVDPARREVRIDTPLSWAKQPVGGIPEARRDPFRMRARTLLGNALAGRADAWEAAHPDADPRCDLASTTITGHGRAHPTLGANPLQLASLIGGERHSEAPACLSPPVAMWLEGCEQLEDRQRQRLRPAIGRLAALGPAISDPGLARRERRTFADWLLRSLSPTLLDAAEADGAERLRSLDPLTEPFSPLDIARSAVEVLMPVKRRSVRSLGVRGGPADRWHAVERVSRAAEHAAQHDPSSMWTPLRAVPEVLGGLLRTSSVEDEWLTALWWAGATKAGVQLFLDAMDAARNAAPLVLEREVSAALRAGFVASRAAGRRDAWDQARDAAASGVFSVDDADDAWPAAIDAARAAAPEHWRAVDEAMDRLPAEVDTLVWTAAASAMADGFADARTSAGVAMATSPASLLCSLLALRADQVGGPDTTADLLWDQVDVLVDELVAIRTP